jgi:hypothetical protein
MVGESAVVRDDSLYARRQYKERPQATLASGELTVTGHGTVTIERALKRSRALFIKSPEAAEVVFVGNDPCPPCNLNVPDTLSWDVIEKKKGHEFYLKISWHVSCARTVLWRVFEVD